MRNCRNTRWEQEILSRTKSYFSSSYVSTQRLTYPSLLSLPPEELLLHIVKQKPMVFIGENHDDQAAKHLLSYLMPHLRKIGGACALEMVRSPNSAEKIDLRPDQEMVDRFVFKGDNEEEVRTAITNYTVDYGNGCIEAKMALLRSARNHGVRVIGIDNSNSNSWNRCQTGNDHWEQILLKWQKKPEIRRIVALVGKSHLHRPNLFNEQAGDLADGIDKRLGAPSIAVHSTSKPKSYAWLGTDGLPYGDIEIRIPENYFVQKHTEQSRSNVEKIFKTMLQREEERVTRQHVMLQL